MLEDKSEGVPGRAKRASAQALLFDPPYLAGKNVKRSISAARKSGFDGKRTLSALI
jgi:hypothetical protein